MKLRYGYLFRLRDTIILGNFIEAISAAGIAYENWPGTSDTTNVRPDGVTQIYFQDPDGYWIEVNDAVNFR